MLFDVLGDAFGAFDGLNEGDLIASFGAHDLYISYAAGDGNDIALRTFSAVPEPNSATLLAALCLGFMPRRKRHKA
jgi:hypothetical protein